MAKSNKLFYIGQRCNPQLKNPYYKAYGQLSKKEVKEKEDCLYGSMWLTPYSTEEEYYNKLNELKENGFKVYKQIGCLIE
jgi:hypothetical protein